MQTQFGLSVKYELNGINAQTRQPALETDARKQQIRSRREFLCNSANALFPMAVAAPAHTFGGYPRVTSMRSPSKVPLVPSRLVLTICEHYSQTGEYPMLATLMRLVGVVQLLLERQVYLAVPDWLLAAMGHSSIAADIRYPLGMLAARFWCMAPPAIWAARQPQAHRPWIWGMVAIQLVDLVVGVSHTLAGSVPLSLSGFPMFNALWISAVAGLRLAPLGCRIVCATRWVVARPFCGWVRGLGWRGVCTAASRSANSSHHVSDAKKPCQMWPIAPHLANPRLRRPPPSTHHQSAAGWLTPPARFGLLCHRCRCRVQFHVVADHAHVVEHVRAVADQGGAFHR